ncbi:MAG: hypothetical protein U5N10_05975 [Gemmobacter sp.]|nr:hypothetical protein [Gemmobacter sp.]
MPQFQIALSGRLWRRARIRFPGLAYDGIAAMGALAETGNGECADRHAR